MKRNKLSDVFNSRIIVLSVFAVFFLAWIISFHNRYIEADECILGEYSFSFLTEGFVRVKSIPLISDWDVRLFAHHKFFTWFGAVIITVFGWSITWLKMSMLPWFFLFFVFLYQYLRLLNLEKIYFFWAAILIFTAPIILLKSYSFRPDIILMTEGMALLYFLTRVKTSENYVWAIYAGATAGLGFLTHINGAAFCITGFVFLAIQKNWKLILSYVLVGGIVGGIYFIELLPPGNFDAFITQLKNWPTVNHGENFVGSGGIGSLLLERILKLASEHQRFFWGDKVIGFSSLFFLSLILAFKYLKKEHSDVMLFLLVLVLSLNIFGSHVAERYILFYYGPMSIITVLGLFHVINRYDWQRYLIILGLVTHFYLSINVLLKIYDRNYNTVEYNSLAFSKIPGSDSKILVPYEMIYNEFPNRDLYVFKTYEYLSEEIEGGMSQQQLFETADGLGMDYIIINQKLADDKSAWFYGWRVEDNPYFNEYYREENLLILKNSTTVSK